MILSEQLREETFDDSYILETNSRKNAHLQIIQIIQRLLSHVNKKDWQQSFIGRRNTSLGQVGPKVGSGRPDSELGPGRLSRLSSYVYELMSSFIT
jgi:hypothetical protein